MSTARRMGPSDRIDRYAVQRNGWTPAQLPAPPPQMTSRQMRRFMHKLKRHSAAPRDARGGTR